MKKFVAAGALALGFTLSALPAQASDPTPPPAPGDQLAFCQYYLSATTDNLAGVTAIMRADDRRISRLEWKVIHQRKLIRHLRAQLAAKR